LHVAQDLEKTSGKPSSIAFSATYQPKNLGILCNMTKEVSFPTRIMQSLLMAWLLCGTATAFISPPALPLRTSPNLRMSRFASPARSLRLSGGSGFPDVSMTGASTHNSPIEEEVLKDHAELKQYYDHYKTSGDMKWYHQFVWELCRHSVGEEIVVYPLLDSFGDSGMY
jgi:hypothetical protein